MEALEQDQRELRREFLAVLYGNDPEKLGIVSRLIALEKNQKLMIALMAFLGGNIVISVLQLIVQLASK